MKKSRGSSVIRALQPTDWGALPHLFSAAFCRVEPFASLSDAERLEAATKVLNQTRHGGDGTLVEPASFVAVDSISPTITGVILVTLPYQDTLEGLRGQPHLSWIFVAPVCARDSVGTALLHRTVQQLGALGYRQLFGTFLLGNDPSMLWHWRNRFELMVDQ